MYVVMVLSWCFCCSIQHLITSGNPLHTDLNQGVTLLQDHLWHLYIQIHHWISSSWEESEGIGKHTHTHTEAPWESERRFRSFFAQLPTAKEWTLKWYSHGTSRNVGKRGGWLSTYNDNLKMILCTRSTFSFFSRASILRIDVFDCKGGAIYSETHAGAYPLGT